MHVDVILFGAHAQLLAPDRKGRASIDVPDGSTVATVLDALAVPEEGRVFLKLDDERVRPDTPLHDGAELRVIVPLGGG